MSQIKLAYIIDFGIFPYLLKILINDLKESHYFFISFEED